MTTSAIITTYLVSQNVDVLISDEDPLLRTRNRVQYTNTIKVYQGVDNLINVRMRNNDQRPADITGMNFVMSLSGDIGNVAIQQHPVTISNVAGGTGSVVINQANAANLTQEWYYFTIKYNSPTNGNITLPAFVDDNFGAVGKIQVISNVF